MTLIPLLALPAALAAQSGSQSGRDRGALVFELRRTAQEAYETARHEIQYQSTREEELLLRLHSVWAGSRVLFDQIVEQNASAHQIEETLSIERLLAQEADEAMARAQGTRPVTAAWNDVRAALGLLLREYRLEPLGQERAGGEEPRDDSSDRTESEPPRPEDLSARITSTDWLGGFTPDLEVRGVIEGRRLESVVLEVHDDEGDVVFRDDTQLQRQLDMATQGASRREDVRIDWRIRIDDDDLASGQNRIVLRVTNDADESVEAEVTVRKRLF